MAVQSKEYVVETAGLTELQSVGLQYALDKYSDLEISVVRREQTVPHTDRDCWLVTPETAIGQIGFFMPRKEKTLVLSRDCVEDAFKCVGNDSPVSEIAGAVESILLSNKKEQSHSNGLSSRETDVLRGLAEGLTAKEIADRLCISVNTVLTHRKNISSKLGIRSVSGLSLYAMMNGVI